MFFILSAERLINELKKSEMNSDEILNYRLLSNFHLLSTRQKSNIEIALENLITIASEIEGKENSAVIYGEYLLIDKSSCGRLL